MKKLLDNYHNLSKDKKKLVNLLLIDQGIDINSKVILPQVRETDLFPLSFAQQRLWFLEQLEPESPLYIIPSGVKIEGNINIEFLINSINQIVNRHEILRTKFIEKNGEGYQEILPELIVEPIVHDLRNVDIEVNLEIEKIISTEFTRPFILSECPLFRIVVIKESASKNYLLLPMHHIVSDNWSTGILISELIQFYNQQMQGYELNVPHLDIQYLDYAIWQREWINGGEFDKQLEYWTGQLKDSNEILEIIPDKKRTAQQSYNGSFELFDINEELVQKLEALCRNEDMTIFILFLAAYQITLSKYSLQDDINIGVPIANRNRTEIEQLIGFFINTLVFRGKLSKTQTIREFLKETKQTSLEAYSNQDIPFEMIVDELNLKRDMSHTALFQAMLVLNNAPVIKLELEGAKIDPLDIDTGKTKFDLVLSLTKNGSNFVGKFEFNTDLYLRETVQVMIRNFIYVLHQISEYTDSMLSEIELSSNKDILKLLSSVQNKAVLQNTPNLLHEEFESVVRRCNNKIAVTDGSNSYTHDQLNDKANIIANELIDRGINLEETVGIYLDRRIDYIAAILGILKSGGVIIPLDITMPMERLEYVRSDSKIKFVLTSNNIVSDLLPKNIEKINMEDLFNYEKNKSNPSRKIFADSAAYIIYTSGSTGSPKGVVVEHQKIAKHITQTIFDFEVSSEDKYLAFATFNFDASLEQIFVPLIAGAEIYLRGNDYWLPTDFIELIKKENITVINPPTVYWNEFVNALKDRKDKSLGNLRLVISGGEEMKIDLLSTWRKVSSDKVHLVNAYGPTETVITSSIFKIDDKITLSNSLHTPIGKVTGLRNFFVLDSNRNLVPHNVPGELCIGGEYLARGYLGNSYVTAEKFIPDNYSGNPGGRLYKTGDLVRYDHDGFIEYLGRIDNQVKIRGFRIELGEIEEILINSKLVENAVVTTNSISEENENLVAFVVCNNENINNELTEYCKKKLPKYMVPNYIIPISEIPLNSNGKPDRGKLQLPPDLKLSTNLGYVEPRTELEKELAALICTSLGLKKVGIFDNFFELGGHSILAIKLISKVREMFGVEVQLKSLFENPTTAGLAEAVVAEQSKLVGDDELESLLSELEELE